MTYDSQILQILTEVGDKGISVRSLTKHIFNMNSTLFFTPDIEEVYIYVRRFLLKNSKKPQSAIERTAQRGWYRLNTDHSDAARQLMFQFNQTDIPDELQENEEKGEKPQQDLSLSLFDF